MRKLLRDVNGLLCIQIICCGLVFPILIVLCLSGYWIYLLLATCHLTVAVASLEIMYIISILHDQVHRTSCLLQNPLSQASYSQCTDMSGLSNRFWSFCYATCSRWVSAVLVLLSYSACFYMMTCVETRHITPQKNVHTFHGRMLLTYCLLMILSSVFCGVFAPNKGGASVMAVYQACFLTLTYSAFIVDRGMVMLSTSDSFFLFLVALAVIITMRITQSRDILESILSIVFDIMGLFCIVGPLALISECLVHRNIIHVRYELIQFFVGIWFSQIGYHLTLYFPTIINHIHMLESLRRICIFDSVVVVAFGLAGFLGSYFILGGLQCINEQLLIMFSGIFVAQLFRKVFHQHIYFSYIFSRNAQPPYRFCVIEWISPFLVASVVIYPYIMYRISALASSS